MNDPILENGYSHGHLNRPISSPEHGGFEIGDSKSDDEPSNRPRKLAWLILIPFVLVLTALGIVMLANINNVRSSIWCVTSTCDTLDSAPSSQSGIATDLRLPRFIRPIHYKLHMIPYLANSTAAGNVWIHIICTETVPNITIHMKNITVLKTSVVELPMAAQVFRTARQIIGSAASEWNLPFIPVIGHAVDEGRDFYTLILAEPLIEGYEYRVHVEFTALLNPALDGLYRSSYVDQASNETRYLAVTQFEPISARLAFPCFDEPQLKATFEVSIGREGHMTTISNMERTTTEPMEEQAENTWFWDHFQKTPPMSTYLVAFIVSEFHYKETHFVSHSPVNGSQLLKPFRVWARPELINQTEYAIRIGPRLVEFFADYLGVGYPLGKLDLGGVPDFDRGAMENWGLITFKESEVLLIESSTPQATKDSIATTIAHEISHNWFGDLVTIHWWSDLWLNEGFACYMEYVGVDHVEPTWNKMQTFVSTEMWEVFGTDSLNSSHPVSVQIEHPNEVLEMFDAISYSKGGSIIRMVSHFLTEATFRAGLKRYLTDWKFNNTRPENLWEAMTVQARLDRTLSATDGFTVEDVMRGWSTQVGYPVVQVERNYKKTEMALFTQRKFMLNLNQSDMAQVDQTNSRWWIPISIASPSTNRDFSSTQPSFWLAPDLEPYATEKKLKVRPDEWLIVNVGQTGFYRVNYDIKNWHLLLAQLTSRPAAIGVVNRAQIIEDAWSLARASMLPYEIVFKLSDYLRDGQEWEYLPWKAYVNSANFMYNMMTGRKEFEHLKSYISAVIDQELTRIGFDVRTSESVPQKRQKAALIYLACLSERPDCVKYSKKMFAKWMAEGNNSIPVDYRKTVYCTAIQNGNDSDWSFLMEQYLFESNFPANQRIMLHGLTCSRNVSTLSRLLKMATETNNNIRRGDAVFVFNEVALNPIGTMIVVNNLYDKWLTVQTYNPDMDPVFSVIGDQLNTRAELSRMVQFQSKYKDQLGTCTRAIDQSIENISMNTLWMEAHSTLVIQLMQKFNDTRNFIN